MLTQLLDFVCNGVGCVCATNVTKSSILGEVNFETVTVFTTLNIFEVNNNI